MTKENIKAWLAGHKILSGFLIFIILLIIIGAIYLGGKNMSNAPATGKKIEAKNSYACPELSNMKLQDYNHELATWTAEIENYKTATEEISYGYTADIDGKTVIYCSVGDEKGGNTSYVYCGDTMKFIKLDVLDNKGMVTKSVGVQVIFNKSTKEYVRTECGAYKLI